MENQRNQGTRIRRVLIATKSQKRLSRLSAWPPEGNTISSKCEEAINRLDLLLLYLFVFDVMKWWYQFTRGILGDQPTEVQMSHNTTGSNWVPETLILSPHCPVCLLFTAVPLQTAFHNTDLQVCVWRHLKGPPHTMCTPTQYHLLAQSQSPPSGLYGLLVHVT